MESSSYCTQSLLAAEEASPEVAAGEERRRTTRRMRRGFRVSRWAAEAEAEPVCAAEARGDWGRRIGGARAPVEQWKEPTAFLSLPILPIRNERLDVYRYQYRPVLFLDHKDAPKSRYNNKLLASCKYILIR
jgi:hypothetical protein